MAEEPLNISSVNNKRIAKNTVFLYLRMALSILVSLYTSRVVLQVLGVEDFGIYSLVGGIVVMFQFINTSLSGATSRFLAYELGAGDQAKLSDTFSTALIAHIMIALVVFVIAETVGLWFFATKLVIPEERMVAAHIVYQCSILSLMISFTQVPYNASIISHENMDVFAYIELLSVFLRLGIVFLLVIGNLDKLILYAILVLVVSVVVAVIYRMYAIRHYEECSFHLIWQPRILKKLLSFSGWTLYTQSTGSFRQFFTNSLINIMCGVVYNAASGITLTVYGALSAFGVNVITAFRPQIIKQYAQGKINEMVTLVLNASKYSVLLFVAIALPFVIELPYILKLWLGTVPPKSIEFIRILLISVVPFILREVVMIGISATNKIKWANLVSGTLSLLVLFPTYLLLKYNFAVELVYVCFLIMRLINHLAILLIVRNIVPEFPLAKYVKDITINILLSASLVTIVLYYTHTVMSTGLMRVVVVGTLSIVLFATYTYFIVIDGTTRKEVNNKLKHLFNRY